MLSAVAFGDFQRSVLGFRATRAQRVYCAVAFDGVEPGGGSLRARDREVARAMFGPVSEVSESARAVLAVVKGRDGGFTRMFAQRLLHLALTLPLGSVDPAEVPFALFLGPKVRHGRIGLRFARLEARKVPGVRVESESRDGFTLIREDGRRVRLEVASAQRGGDSGRGVPIVAALLDESAFFRDAAGAVNDADVFAALVPRLLPGGQVGIVSTPWSESGLLWELFRSNHGAPRTALAAHCPTPLMRDDPATLSMIGRERERDPENARREFDGEFMLAGGGQFFTHDELREARDASGALGALPEPGRAVFVGADPALVSDAAAAVVVHRDGAGVLRVADLLELRPERGRPLALDYVVSKFAGLALRHGARSVTSDAHMLSEVRRHAQPFAVRVSAIPGGSTGKQRVYQHARDLVRAGRVRFPPGCERLVAQLSDVVARPTSGGGLSITSPRRSGSHGDLVSALVAALWAAKVGGDSVDRVLLARARGESGHRPEAPHGLGSVARHGVQTTGRAETLGQGDSAVTFSVTPTGVIATPGRRDAHGRLGQAVEQRRPEGAPSMRQRLRPRGMF
ncbi:MAG: hypothetical protein IPM35_04660 [Myxococcales bacterium]|nr:hypothetical protein [Myxococcales bacterium]